MAKFKTLEVAGWIPALKGMRNPLKSYSRIDSYIGSDNHIVIGPNDYDLARRLIIGGPPHRKFLRQICVWVDISAARFWWNEFDTYKIGTSANSESTMHTLLKEPITLDMFEFDTNLESDILALASTYVFEEYINGLEDTRKYIADLTDIKLKNKYLSLLKSMLPESFIQTRTVCLNYEVLSNMYYWRKDHRLPQWNTDFVNWIKTLPYNEFITQEWPEEK